MSIRELAKHWCGHLAATRAWIAVLAVAAMLGAALASPLAAQQPQQQETQQPPEPDTSRPEGDGKSVAALVDPSSYVIGPEDVLQIRVWREPELSGTVGVRPDGKITLPLIGDVTAAGTTPQKLTADISEALSKYINRPQVLVSVLAVQSKKYLVSGEVQRPGSYPYVIPVKIVEALVRAGGLKEWANKKKITVVRGNERIFFNYADWIKGKNLERNIQIENGDHIIVP